MVTRPILRYHGGKWMLAPWIISHFPEHKIYTETYGGAASILLQKQKVYAEIYNDLDNEVVNLFKVARDKGPELITLLELTPFSRVEFNQSFDLNCDPIELARRTIIRSLMGFASGIASGHKTGFRANNNSAVTTPAYDWMNYTNGLKQIIDRLKTCVIENRSAIEVIKQHDSPETLHYLDPPYLKNTRWKKQKTRVYKFEMADDEHEVLLKSLIPLKGMIILSGYDNELYNDLLIGWKKSQKKFLADGLPGNRERIETLWISPNTPLLQQKLF